jgi:hypothetical protein
MNVCDVKRVSFSRTIDAAVGSTFQHMPDDVSNLLGLIAQVAVAFIGFSMVVGVLRPDEAHGKSRIQSMRAVAETALIAGGGALLALALSALGLTSDLVWRVAILIVAVTWARAFAHAVRRFRGAGAPLAFDSLQSIVMTCVVASAIGLLLWNVVAPTGPAGGRYAAALTLALVISARRFVFANFKIGDAGPAA